LKRIGVFTATRWEQEAVCGAILVEQRTRIGRSGCVVGTCGACRVYVFQTGIGPVKAGAVCRDALAAQSWDLAVSSGFACALTPSHIGDLLIGTDVLPRYQGNVSPDRGLSCAVEWHEAALRAAGDARVTARSGRFVAVSKVLWLAEQKRRIAADTTALGLDMESGAIGAAAAERGVPFVVARTVSDLLDEDLPLDFNLFLDRAGWVSGVWQVLSSPSRLAGINRLRRQSRLAGDNLTRVMQGFLKGLA
jgi:adenosylhomocysteine nucleosidase